MYKRQVEGRYLYSEIKGEYEVLEIQGYYKKVLPNGLDNKVIKAALHQCRHDNNFSDAEVMEVIKFIDSFVACLLDKMRLKKLTCRICGEKGAVAEKSRCFCKS